MTQKHKFGIIGGDARQIYLAKSLQKDGWSVRISGLEMHEMSGELLSLPIKELCETCDICVLPLPITRDSETLYAPHASVPIALNDSFAENFRSNIVYGGLTQKLTRSSELWEEIAVSDYYSREELTVANAMLTAEGAIALAIENSPLALNHMRCLVTGFGRIGKAMLLALTALNAQVDGAARKKQDLQGIWNMGCTPVTYQDINQKYDVIFNTVPTVVLPRTALKSQDSSTIIIELASMPGGVDLPCAAELKIPVVNGQSLPGRFSPHSAGEFIKEAILNMMEE